jgi:NADH-quinone oxidoreductase subunit H
MIDLAQLFPHADPQQAPTAIGTFVLASSIKILVVFVLYLLGVAFLTLAERKLAAWFQDRRGPNRAGPGGILQPVADGIKNFMKEETNPAAADRWLFILAPAMAFIPSMLTWAVLPLAAPLPTPWGLIDMAVASLPVGYLFTLAISSLGVYGIVLAGWSSNNKYALLGGLRSSAQMISYEIAMGMSTIPILLLAGNVSLSAIVQQQAHMGWNVLSLTIAWITFLIAAFAETNRLPFDLPEAESELVAGYHTEYSGIDVLHRRVRQHGDGQRAHVRALLRRVGHPLHAVGQRAAVHDPENTRHAVHVRGEDRILPVCVHVDSVDLAAFPL